MAKGKGYSAQLLGEAAGDEPETEAESDAEENSPEAEHKRVFLEMAKAIKAGDFEKAWSAHQEMQELMS